MSQWVLQTGSECEKFLARLLWPSAVLARHRRPWCGRRDTGYQELLPQGSKHLLLEAPALPVLINLAFSQKKVWKLWGQPSHNGCSPNKPPGGALHFHRSGPSPYKNRPRQ